MIEIKFKGTKVPALVDTGAQISAMTKELYDNLTDSGEEIKVLPIRKFVLRGAFSEKGAIIANKAKLKFKYKDNMYEHEFYVIQRRVYRVCPESNASHFFVT